MSQTNHMLDISILLIYHFSDIPEFLYSTTKNKELRFDIKLFTQCIATWDKDTEKNIYIGRFLALYV